MKCLRGYVSSRAFMGDRLAQHIQNIVLRDYCQKTNFKYLLSGTEYAMSNSYLMLKELVDEIPKINGIVMFSLFQMPEDQNFRKDFYAKILSKAGELHFALENLRITDNREIDRIERIWLVRQTMPDCPTKIQTNHKMV